MFRLNSKRRNSVEKVDVVPNVLTDFNDPVLVYLEDHPGTCKWLIAMVSKSPNSGCSPSKWPKWLINGGYQLFADWHHPPSSLIAGFSLHHELPGPVSSQPYGSFTRRLARQTRIL